MNEHLREIPDNPLPANAAAGLLETADGKFLRYGCFAPSQSPPRGTVILLQGRNECIEKYFETIRDLQERGLAVAMLDWRGQGGSGRLLRDQSRGHIDAFDTYVRDLEQFFQEVVLPDCRGPFFVLAHSTGALIALLSAPQWTHRIRRMVLVAPLLSLQDLPVSMKGLKRLAGSLRWTGLAHLPLGARGAGEDAMRKLTSDSERFRRNRELCQTHPELLLGPPSAGWVHAACVAMETVQRDEFVARIRVPALIVAAGADRVVSTPTIEAYARGLRSASTLVIDGARHEILQEADFYREQFWAAFDAFVPGGDAGEEQVEAVSSE